jgi:acylglycerol lipase
MKTHKEDCLRFVSMVKEMYPDLPLFCLGFSMGGLTSYHLGLTHAHLFEGIIMMAPALKNIRCNSLTYLVNCLKTITPQYTQLIYPRYGLCNRNPALTPFSLSDPYTYKGRMYLSTVHFLTNSMNSVSATFKDFQCPFLVIQGGTDKMVHPMGAFELYQQSPLSEKDKDIIFIEDMWHNIWH